MRIYGIDSSELKKYTNWRFINNCYFNKTQNGSTTTTLVCIFTFQLTVNGIPGAAAVLRVGLE